MERTNGAALNTVESLWMRVESEAEMGLPKRDWSCSHQADWRG